MFELITWKEVSVKSKNHFWKANPGGPNSTKGLPSK